MLRYLNEQSSNQPANYVWRVADYFEQWHGYVCAIQMEKRADVWDPLYIQLQKWAYKHLERQNFPANGHKGDRFQHALDCATEAAITLINAHFPYDVKFDPWACILVQNVSYKHMVKATNQAKLGDKEIIDLDAWHEWLHNIIDPTGENSQRLTEHRHDLLAAIEKLSSVSREEFILLYYFEQNTFEQIAAKLGRQVNALYKLHFDALAELRKIWGINRDKYG